MNGQDVYNMTQIAYVQSQIICAQAEILGMEAENKQREIEGKSMTYVHEDFLKVLETYGLYHNSVLETLRAYW